MGPGHTSLALGHTSLVPSLYCSDFSDILSGGMRACLSIFIVFMHMCVFM
jgi:hypothetical protein